MSYITFKDISYSQGVYNMAGNSDPAVMMKMSGGDGITTKLYYDSQAARNYQQAVIHGKVPMMYHFYGGGDPIVEADFFIKACSPLAPGDILAIDLERGTYWNPQIDPNAVAKIKAFVTHVHDATGLWPWVYMNMSTANMYGWSPVFNNCAYWCAAPSFSFDATLPVKYPQMAQQGPVVSGVDTDAFFGTIEELKKYGYQVPQAPTPAPTPVPPAPVAEPTPAPVTPPAPVAAPEPPVVQDPPSQPAPTESQPAQSPDLPAPVVVVSTPAQSWVQRLIDLLKSWFGIH